MVLSLSKIPILRTRLWSDQINWDIRSESRPISNAQCTHKQLDVEPSYPSMLDSDRITTHLRFRTKLITAISSFVLAVMFDIILYGIIHIWTIITIRRSRLLLFSSDLPFCSVDFSTLHFFTSKLTTHNL